ncbi:SDR family NAD(P)-dependent oxidoreductase [Yinghuangia aomiensis]
MTDSDAGVDFAARYGPWALVAGASEGIGAAVADQLAERGLHLVLVARNEPLLHEVADRLRKRHGTQVRPLTLDLTDPQVGARVQAATEGLEVGMVVYNAGAVNRSTTFLEDSFEDSLAQIELACIGPVALARLFAPAMQQRGHGGIILVGSMVCLAGAARAAVYSAVKMFNVNFAEGLWAELHEHGVDVCCTPLGTVHTPAMQRMGATFDPAQDMRPEDVAREILENVGNGPTHVVGESNRTLASHMWPVDRRLAVEAMSAGTAAYAARTTDG